MALTGISRALSGGLGFGNVKQVRINGIAGRLALGAFVVGACLGLGGCDQTKKTEQVVDQRAAEAQQALDSTQKVPHALIYDPLTVSNKVWGGNAALRMQRGMPLPSRYEVPRGVTLVSADPMTLNDITNAISAQTGIPVRLNAMTMTSKSATSGTPGAPTPPTPILRAAVPILHHPSHLAERIRQFLMKARCQDF